MNNEMLLRRLEEVIVTDATDTSPAAFLATHIPFKNLYYTSSGIGENIEREIAEDVFLKNYMLERMEHHNLIVVEGPSGSGKSHFIRWLMEKYTTQKEASDLVIPIRRHQNTLKGAIEQILKASVFQDEAHKQILNKLFLAQEQLNDQELIYYIKNNLLTKLEAKRDFDGCQINERQNSKLIEFIKCTYIFDQLLSVEGGPFERLYRKISSNNQNTIQDEFDAKFQAQDFNISIELQEKIEDESNDCNRGARGFARDLYRDKNSEGVFRQNVADYLNSMLDQVIQMCLNLSGEDFQQIFYEIRKELKKQNKTLTLFVEDITSFTGIDKSLLEALLVDHQGKEELCRIYSIVGTTSTYYSSYVPDNIKQRVTGRVIIKEDSIFKDEQDRMKMAARYLNTINTPKEVLLEWYDNGASIESLPIAHLYDDDPWSLFEDDTIGKISIFPFNQTALLNLYSTMAEKTPRIFLKEIIKYVYRLYLVAPNAFPGSWKSFENYYKVPRWKEDAHEQLVDTQAGQEAEKVSCILRVWGDGTAYCTQDEEEIKLGGLPKKLFDRFNVPFIEGKTVIGTKMVAPKDKTPSMTKEVPLGKEPAKVVSTAPDQPTTNPYEEACKKLSDWYDKKQPLMIHQDLRKEVAGALDAFVEWPEEVSMYLVKQFLGTSGSSKGSIVRISIEGQNVPINEDGLILGRSKEDYNFLKALLGYKHLGKGSWAYDIALDHILIVQQWAQSNREKLVQLITKSQEEQKWPVLELGISNQYMLSVIAGEIKEAETVEELYNCIIKTKSIRESSDYSETWNKGISMIQPQFLQDNAMWVQRLYNILLGDAQPDTPKLFIDAHQILKVIEQLKAQNWKVDTQEGTITTDILYDTYRLYILLQKVKTYLVKNEESYLKKLLDEIKKYVKYEEIHTSFFRIQAFLTQTLAGNKEHYIEDEFAMVLKNSDKVLDQIARNIQEAMLFSKNKYNNSEDVLIALSKLPLNQISRYVNLLKNVDKQLQQLETKYANQAETQKAQANAYEVTKQTLKNNVDTAYKYLQSLGGK